MIDPPPKQGDILRLEISAKYLSHDSKGFRLWADGNPAMYVPIRAVCKVEVERPVLPSGWAWERITDGNGTRLCAYWRSENGNFFVRASVDERGDFHVMSNTTDLTQDISEMKVPTQVISAVLRANGREDIHG